MGALKLAAACRDVTRYFASGEFHSAPAKLDALVDHVITEMIRVQRKLHDLLTFAAESH